MKTNHTKDQRHRLFLLARLLDRVPPKRFNMRAWISENDLSLYSDIKSAERLKALECGFAGCAIGWGLTSPAIRGDARLPRNLLDNLGFNGDFIGLPDDTGTMLFGPKRKATPKRVASDIRRYLKDGMLPK